MEQELKPLEKRIPKRAIHTMFGVCFDKTDTYTVTKAPDLNNSNTVRRILLGTKTWVQEDKETIILFTYEDKSYVEFFNVTLDLKIDKFSTSTKKEVQENLKKAVEIVVVQADKNSLKLPNKRKTDSFYISSDFNSDSSLYERIKFAKTYTKVWNEETETYEKRLITEKEIREYSTRRNVDIIFLSSGKEHKLSKTLGSLQHEKWGDLIDKSGYNRNARLVSNYFKLQEFKANKVKEKLNKGENKVLETEINNSISFNKKLLSLYLEKTNINNTELFDSYFRNLKQLNNSYNKTLSHIKNIGTDKEYTPYTMEIMKDLEEIKSSLNTLNGKLTMLVEE